MLVREGFLRSDSEVFLSSVPAALFSSDREGFFSRDGSRCWCFGSESGMAAALRDVERGGGCSTGVSRLDRWPGLGSLTTRLVDRGGSTVGSSCNTGANSRLLPLSWSVVLGDCAVPVLVGVSDLADRLAPLNQKLDLVDGFSLRVEVLVEGLWLGWLTLLLLCLVFPEEELWMDSARSLSLRCFL